MAARGMADGASSGWWQIPAPAGLRGADRQAAPGPRSSAVGTCHSPPRTRRSAVGPQPGASRSAAGQRGHPCAVAVRSFLRPVPAGRRDDCAGNGEHQQRLQGESPEDDQRNAAEHHDGQRLPARAAQVRRVAGCRGGSLVSMSFTSTNTGSNCVWFTPYHWRTRCKGAAARPPVAGIEQRDSPGPVSGVASGRHPVAADQPGAGRGSACSWRPTLPSAAFLAAVEDPASPG